MLCAAIIVYSAPKYSGPQFDVFADFKKSTKYCANKKYTILYNHDFALWDVYEIVEYAK